MIFVRVVLFINLLVLGSATSPSAAPSSSRSSLNSIRTVVGTGVEGNTGVGGPATAATFNFPFGIWEDSVGALYVGGQYNNCVRKFSTTGSSIMTLVVGQCGSDGFGGDGGPATSATLSTTMGVVGASTGVLYVGEQGNGRVRAVSASGKISTYAGSGSGSVSGDGGPASAAGIPSVNGVWINSANVMFIVMMSFGSVRSVDVAGIVAQYAGSYVAGNFGDGGPATSAKFSTFNRILGDTLGVMYVGDSSNFVLRQISTSGIVTILGGTGSTVYEGHENIAFTSFSVGGVRDIVVDANNGDIYASSMGTSRIYVNTHSTGLTSIYAGTGSSSSSGDGGAATSAGFNTNDGLLLDSTGQLYVLEYYGNKGRVIYTVSPSAAPSAKPSTLTPTARPSTASPTLQPLAIRSSPSYKVANYYAFAGLTTSGSVMTWGSSAAGGDSSSVSSLLVNVKEVVSSKNAFAARKSDGSVVAWGEASAVSGGSVYRSATNIMSLSATERAFAGVTSDGGVIAFGAGCCGGNVDEYGSWSSSYLSSGVETVVGNAGAFCALKSEGTVYCWGSEFAGGGVSSVSRSDLTDIVLLVSTRSAFAGMKSDGSVVSWGNKYFGGVMPAYVSSVLSQHTLHIVSRETAFVAYTDTSMLHSWSAADSGGGADLSEPGGVKYVAHTSKAFAAVRTNGSLVCWGDRLYGGDCSSSSVTGNVTSIVGNKLAFVAVKSSGDAVAWGAANHGGNPAANVTVLLKSVISVHQTSRAFAALKSDGSVVTWGASDFGGSVDVSVASYLSSSVKMICSNEISFVAIRHDGNAVCWGSSAILGKSAMLLSGDYSSVTSC